MSHLTGSVDVHQHLWPGQLVDALRTRRQSPRLQGWTLHLPGEPSYDVAASDHNVPRRQELDPAHDHVLLSLSSPLGIEQLPPDEAQPLLRAWHDGVRQLPQPFAAWASVNQLEPDLQLLTEQLRGEFVGLQVPATQLATPEALTRTADVLRTCEVADKPVLVHPGPAATRTEEVPAWWSAVVDYPAQMQAAWWSWHSIGRSLLPELRICFAAGAGLAPIHHERLAARGGGPMRSDLNTFVDTSSYGPRGLDSLVRVLGIDAIVLGSDRPYAAPTDPDLGTAATHAIRVVNPRRLLEGGQP
ncbi:MAG: amidohydrolase [Propionibacteriales bacterium]|nr:amidohydrolase [Propionibacteriales bacterium]